MKRSLKTIPKLIVGILPLKRQLFSVLRPFDPPKRIWNQLRFKGEFSVVVNEESSFLMNHYGYRLENEIFWRGLYEGGGEEQPLRLWLKLCAEAATILDIGANIGIYSLVAKTVNRGAKVYGFEPVAHLHRKLKKNCELNEFDVVCEHAALSNQDGFADIFIRPGGFATASLNPKPSGTEQESVKTYTLSTYIETTRTRNVDLMKIDVEGYEPQVLEGMGKYLGLMKPAMLIEILSNEVGRKVEALVKECNYVYFNIDESKGPVRQQHLSITGKSRHSRNFLLCNELVANRLNLL